MRALSIWASSRRATSMTAASRRATSMTAASRRATSMTAASRATATSLSLRATWIARSAWRAIVSMCITSLGTIGWGVGDAPGHKGIAHIHMRLYISSTILASLISGLRIRIIYTWWWWSLNVPSPLATWTLSMLCWAELTPSLFLLRADSFLH